MFQDPARQVAFVLTLVLAQVMFCVANADVPPPPGATVKRSDGGFILASDDGQYSLRLRGPLQTDGRFFLGDDDHKAVDQFVLRSARPYFDATLRTS